MEGQAKVIEGQAQLLRILQLQAADEVTTTMSDPEYESVVRGQLPSILLHRCGLEVANVDAGDFERTLEGQQWDFRAPVTIATTAPNPNREVGVFEIFPSKQTYVRPAQVSARNITPSKYGGRDQPPAAHYLAIFEITTARHWTWGSRSKEPMLARLEKRLCISLDRATSTPESGIPADASILDVVAVVGVVVPKEFSQSARDLMDGNPAAYEKLRLMMDNGRFVFIQHGRQSPRASPGAGPHRVGS